MDRAGKFWLRVAPEPGLGGCFIWTGARTTPPRGEPYGRVRVGGRSVMATHFVWEMERGPIPEGLLVLHHCDRPLCVRPNHLFLGTHKDNAADMRGKGRAPRWDGGRNPNARLTAADVKAMRARYWADGVTQKQLVQEFGISQAQVSKIIRGVAWSTS